MPKVLVTVAPLKPVADAILAGITHSSVLARPGQDSHHMVLSPSQSQALAEADIIIVPDRTFSSAVNTMATRRAKKGATIISLTELRGAQALPYAQKQPWLGAKATKAKKKERGPSDPHLWLDPLRMAAIATPLAEAIAQKTPSLRAQLLGNAVEWKRHLSMQLDPALERILGAVETKQRYNSRPYIPFITSHSAYQYFLSRYRIEDHGSLSLVPEDVTGAASQHAVLARAGEVTIGCIIAEQETALVKRVAAASNARIVLFNPESLPGSNVGAGFDFITSDYDRLLYRTAETFAGCL